MHLAEAEPEKDSFLHPAVDSPTFHIAVFGGSVSCTYFSVVEEELEFVERPKRSIAVKRSRILVEEILDLLFECHFRFSVFVRWVYLVPGLKKLG